jgi:predicted extracellular nuclease
MPAHRCKQSEPHAATRWRALLRLAAIVPVALAGLAALPVFAVSDVVISQVYGGGGNAGALYRHDFIELFNRGAAPVSLSGWSVQYASPASSSWSATPLPATVLQPGQYLLVQASAGAGGLLALPTPEAAGTLALGAAAGKVLLANTGSAVANPNASSVLDLVGFGAAAVAFEGTGPASAPSNTMAIVRAGHGCDDTDDNSADFTVAAPAPRNGNAALNPCGAGNAPVIPQCPDRFAVIAGSGGSTRISARDADGMVTGATIVAGAVPGIRILAVHAASAGASFSLDIAPAVAAGAYPLAIRFANDQDQAARCAITVDVQSAAAGVHGIAQIQGSGATSEYAGSVQSTGGVVTLLASNGYYLQDPDGDGDPATSDGIFVFTGSMPTLSVGDRIKLTATVAEFDAGDASRTVTRLTAVSDTVLVSRGNTVVPTDIALPLANPDTFERFEGMLVRVAVPLTVSQNYFQGRYGQLTLSAGRLEKPTNRHAPRSAQAVAAAAVNAANRLVLDDGRSAQNPYPIPYLGADGTLRAGDSVAGLVGVIDFGLVTASNPGPGGYKLQPAVPPVFSRDNPRTGVPVLPAGNVRVASFNVLNFFTTFADGATASGLTGQGCTQGASTARSHCRGAGNLAEFQRQRAKIVAAIGAVDADVLGLMEIQNNGDTALANLVDALNAAAPGSGYALVPRPPATGSDAIRVAMIYKPSRLTLVGAALSDADPINSRPPMAQTFAARNGEKFSLIVNHLKSKGSCPAADGAHADADAGDGQGCWNGTRVRQAQRLASVFLPRVQAAADDADVLVIGDMNAYGMEDPIAELGNAGLANQVERFLRRGGMPYSYVFDGEAGTLDHALATSSLGLQVMGVAQWHSNADEPSVIDYRTGFKPQDLYAPTPYRASDHDPVLVSLQLQAMAVDVTNRFAIASSGSTVNRATGAFHTMVTLTNAGSATIPGPVQLVVGGLPAGVTLANATAYRDGLPCITVAPGPFAPGQGIGAPLVFNNPGRVALHYTPRVYSGTFQELR